jgi:hypothetical protein
VILRAALALLLLLASADPTAAQRGHGFRGATERALHAQMIESDVVAIGTVEDVAPGRIRIGDLSAVEGEITARIELKRSPSRPPGLEPGARIVLLLRGARSPYLLVPSAEEVLRIADDAGEARVIAALRELRAALADPATLVTRYHTWLTGPEDDLRHLAEIALVNPSPPLQRLDASYVRALVDVVTDPTLPLDQRRAAARVAGSDESGVAALLAALPFQDRADADPQLLVEVLRLGALRASPEIHSALLRSLRHESAAIRQAALEMGPIMTRDPTLRAEVERLAREDPSESVRLLAEPLVRARGSELRRSASGNAPDN